LVQKILVINTYVETEDTEKYESFFKDFFNKFSSKGVKVDTCGLRYGAYSLEDSYDMVLNSPFILERAKNAEKKGYDAVIINCFGDPALEAAREIVDIPVIGAGQAALHVASLLGNRLSILFIGSEVTARKYLPKFQRIVSPEKIASIRSIGLTVLEITENEEKCMSLLSNAGKRAIREDGADVLVLGCTGLSGFAEKLQRELNVPVVEPSISALKMAEILISMKLTQSKILYQKPGEKPRVYPPSLKGLKKVMEGT